MTILSKIQGFSFILDFHNYGYTILGLNTRIKPVVWLATKFKFSLYAAEITFPFASDMRNCLPEDLLMGSAYLRQ